MPNQTCMDKTGRGGYEKEVLWRRMEELGTEEGGTSLGTSWASLGTSNQAHSFQRLSLGTSSVSSAWTRHAFQDENDAVADWLGWALEYARWILRHGAEENVPRVWLRCPVCQ
jgi:hypothetical protein